jgi:hypothetical protein
MGVAVSRISPRTTPKPAPVRTVEIRLNGDYSGWIATMRANLKYGLMMDLTGDDEAAQLAALGSLFRSWNWVDEDGEPLPQPQDGGLREADADAIKEALRLWFAEVNEAASLPKA